MLTELKTRVKNYHPKYSTIFLTVTAFFFALIMLFAVFGSSLPEDAETKLDQVPPPLILILIYLVFLITYPIWIIGRWFFLLYKRDQISFPLWTIADTRKLLNDLTKGVFQFGRAIVYLALVLGFVILVILAVFWLNNLINGEKDECLETYKYRALSKVPAYCVKYFD